MKRIMWLVFLISVIMTGCQNNNDAVNHDNNQVDEPYSISYQTEQEQASRSGTGGYNSNHMKSRDELLDGYLSNLDHPDSEDSKYTEYFYNQDAQRINEAVNQFTEVDLTQTMVTDKQEIIVSVMLNQEKYGPNTKRINAKIEQKVRNMYPEHDVIVYTDAVYWNKMRDLDAGSDGDDRNK